MGLHSKSVLITGVEGFTGSHLFNFFENKGFKVYGSALTPINRETIKLDINEYEDVKSVLDEIRPNYIIHLAAISFVGHPHPLDFYKINCLGTENILRALIAINHQSLKVLIPSSATIYGNQESSILEEGMTPRPANHYGCSKLAMENIVSNYFKKIPLIITRPFNYTGPNQRDNFLVPKLVNHFKNQKDVIELGNINVKREFNGIDFLSQVYFQLLTSNVKSTIVNVCSSKTYSISELLESLTKITNHEIKVKVNPDFVRGNEIFELKGSSKLLASLIDVPTLSPIEKTLKDMLSS